LAKDRLSKRRLQRGAGPSPKPGRSVQIVLADRRAHSIRLTKPAVCISVHPCCTSLHRSRGIDHVRREKPQRPIRVHASIPSSSTSSCQSLVSLSELRKPCPWSLVNALRMVNLGFVKPEQPPPPPPPLAPSNITSGTAPNTAVMPNETIRTITQHIKPTNF
jgi:hypothetical protein